MRILLSFLLFAASLSAQETVYKKGIVKDSLKISDSLDGTYSLYLPSEFDGRKELPVVFIFDGEGRGLSAARLFRSAAEEQQYILVSSNNVDPSKELKENFTAAALLVQEVARTLPIDIESVSMAGLAEGAKVVTTLPLLFEDIQGIIYIGDQSFNFEYLEKKNLKTAIGIVGNQQINIGEMEMAAYQLRNLSIPGQLYVFEGGMEWPQPHMISSALGNLTLEAMRSEKRPLDQKLVNKLYLEDLKMADQLMSAGNYLMAKNFLDDLSIKYDDLIKTQEVKERLRQLDRSDKFSEQQEQYAEMLSKEQRLMDDFLFYYNEDVELANFENLGWWNYQKLQLQELTKGTNKMEAAMAYRLMDMLRKMSDAQLASYEDARAPLEEKLIANMLATVFDQQNFEAYKNIISLSTLDGDFPTALFYLEEMLKNGYKEVDSLYEIEGTLGLKITKDYNWLIKKYLGESRYFENATSLD